MHFVRETQVGKCSVHLANFLLQVSLLQLGPTIFGEREGIDYLRTRRLLAQTAQGKMHKSLQLGYQLTLHYLYIVV